MRRPRMTIATSTSTAPMTFAATTITATTMRAARRPSRRDAARRTDDDADHPDARADGACARAATATVSTVTPTLADWNDLRQPVNAGRWDHNGFWNSSWCAAPSTAAAAASVGRAGVLAVRLWRRVLPGVVAVCGCLAVLELRRRLHPGRIVLAERCLGMAAGLRRHRLDKTTTTQVRRRGASRRLQLRPRRRQRGQADASLGRRQRATLIRHLQRLCPGRLGLPIDKIEQTSNRRQPARRPREPGVRVHPSRRHLEGLARASRRSRRSSGRRAAEAPRRHGRRGSTSCARR